MNIITRALIQSIRFYQKTLSPDHSWWAHAMEKPPYCKHIPSCSEYMIESLEKKGLLIGGYRGCMRILRCNPWSKGGYDPVDSPER